MIDPGLRVTLMCPIQAAGFPGDKLAIIGITPISLCGQ